MSKKKKRRHRLGGPSSQNVALGQSELIVRNLAQEPRVRLRLNAAGIGEVGLEKMSDVLLRFAEPILDQVAPLDEKKATLLFAITAWNYCLISSEEQAHMRSELRHIFNNVHHRADFEMLIQRKTELFPRNRRLFMGLEVAESAGGLHVKVVSTDLDRIG
jgi:hypothetical protein